MRQEGVDSVLNDLYEYFTLDDRTWLRLDRHIVNTTGIGFACRIPKKGQCDVVGALDIQKVSMRPAGKGVGIAVAEIRRHPVGE